MEVKAQFHKRIKILTLCVLSGVLGAALLYYGIFFALALINYYDDFYKHDTFYSLYPTAISYLIVFFTQGTLKHLPGYEIEINVGLPLLFVCGMVFAGALLFFMLRNQALEITPDAITGKDIFGRKFSCPAFGARSVPFGGMILKENGKKYLFLFVKNKQQILDMLETIMAL